MTGADGNIRINRAPVLTLWAAVVAERLGFDRETALTLGQAVAGLSAYAKGVSLGIIEPRPELVREQRRPAGRGRAAARRPARPRGAGGAHAGRAAGGEQGQARQPGPDREVPRRQVRRAARRRTRRPWPSWRRPMSRPTSTGAGSGCTSSSGRACPPASRGGVPRASWIWRRCAPSCRPTRAGPSKPTSWRHRAGLFP